jgi:hypothetical protein
MAEDMLEDMPIDSLRLRFRAASSEPTSLPYVAVFLLLGVSLTSSWRALIFCHVLSLRPTEPKSNSLRKTEV